MRVLGIDCGFSTGYGLLGGKKVLSGSFPIAGTSDQMGVALRSFRELMLNRLIPQLSPEVIVAAVPFIGRDATPVSLRPIFGFECRLQEIADDNGIKYFRIYESEARRALVSPAKLPQRSKQIKEAIIAECRNRGWPCTDGHAADALCVADYQRSILMPRRSHENTPLFLARSQ